jgi:hypothetical protein
MIEMSPTLSKHEYQWRNTKSKSKSRKKSKSLKTAKVMSSCHKSPKNYLNVSQSGLKWLEETMESQIALSSSSEKALVKFSFLLKNSGLIRINSGDHSKSIKNIIAKVIRLDKWIICNRLELWKNLRKHLEEETHLKLPISQYVFINVCVSVESQLDVSLKYV